MTEPITSIRDTWVNVNKPGVNYGSTSGVRVKSGEHFIFLLPDLPNIAGATVVDAYLVGRGAAALVARTDTVAPVTERWVPGRVKWDSKPAVNAAAAVNVAQGATAADEVVTWPGLAPMLQAVADGTDWYGLRLTTSTTTGQRFRSTDSGKDAWELYVVLSEVPEIPTNLRPDGGGAVGSAAPVLAWDFLDFGGDSTEQAWFRAQVDTPVVGVEPDEVAPDYDSGWTLGADPEVSLAGVHSVVGAGPHFWRVNVKDADDNESGWSDWAEFTVAALPSLVVDSPVGPFSDPTPALLAHLASGSVKAWRAFATGPERSDVRARSGLQTAPTISWTVPRRNKAGRRVLREDEQGWLYLQVWDTVDRAVAVGEKAFVESWIPATWDQDGVVDPPTNLSVVQTAINEPRLVWTWNRVEAADAWLIQVDGVTVARLEPEDVTVNAGTYSWTDSGEVSPGRLHTLAVRAVDGNATSTASVRSEHRHHTAGLWLLPDEGDPFVIFDTQHGAFTRTDRFASYTPLAGPEVDVIYDYEGRRGTVEGTIFRDMGEVQQDVWQAIDRIEAIKSSRVRTARMVWGSQSVRVRVRDVDVTSHDELDPRDLLHMVRFGFVEVGD